MSVHGFKVFATGQPWGELTVWDGAIAANTNLAPVLKPRQVVRRDPIEAANRLEERFAESMRLLA